MLWQIAAGTIKPLFISTYITALVTLADRCSFATRNCNWSYATPEDATYLVSIAGIGGVLIGLYYTGIISAAASVYSRVPNNVRDLLKLERAGNVYISFLAFATFLSLSFAALDSLSLGLIRYAVPVTWLIAGIGIFAFVNLGRRAFNFFDPVELARPIFADLVRLVTTATPKSAVWRNGPFQENARARARNITQTLSTLASVCEKEEHLQAPFAELSWEAIKFLSWYRRQKRSIPRDSQWYAPRYVQKAWFRTSASETAVHAATYTALDPVVVRDDKWLEEEILPFVLRSVDNSARTAQFEQAMKLVSGLRHYAEASANEWDVASINGVVDQLLKTLAHRAPDGPPTDADDDKSLEFIALVEHSFFLAINAWLTLSLGLTERPRALASQRLNALDWESLPSLYDGTWPTFGLERLEWVRNRLRFEKAVEGMAITPPWYLTELYGVAEAIALKEATTRLLDDFATTCDRAYARFSSKKQVWLTAALLRVEREYWAKFAAHYHRLEGALRDWLDNQKVDFAWPAVDFDALKTKVSDRIHHLNELAGTVLPELLSSKRKETFPDYPGQFTHMLGEFIFEAGLNNHIEPIRKFLPTYLRACLKLTFQGIEESKSGGQDSVRAFQLALDPIIDAMDVSGYLLVCGELHQGSDIRATVEIAWDQFVGNAAENKQPAEWYATGLSLVDTMSMMLPQGQFRIQRQQWMQAQLAGLAKRGSVHRTRDRRSWSSDDEEVDHPSRIVRAVAGELSHLGSGQNIFAALYLIKRLTDKNAINSIRRRTLRDLLDEESKGADEN